MSNVTLVGNIVTDPIFKAGENGKKDRITFRLAENQQPRDGETEGKSDFYNVTVFGSPATNMANSEFGKGNRVIVVGRLDTYEKIVQVEGVDKKMTLTSVTASAVGPDTRWATVKVQRIARATGRADEVPDEPADVPAPAAAARPQAKAAAKPASKPAAAASETVDDIF